MGVVQMARLIKDDQPQLYIRQNESLSLNIVG